MTKTKQIIPFTPVSDWHRRENVRAVRRNVKGTGDICGSWSVDSNDSKEFLLVCRMCRPFLNGSIYLDSRVKG